MSHERDPIWDALKAHSKEKFDGDRARFMADAKQADDGRWTKHTEYHWACMLRGKILDYWPSRKKFMYDRRVMRGDVYAFIKKIESQP